jgi:hypothetical protein
MEVAWPITALYFGPFALWAYVRFGRPMADTVVRTGALEMTPQPRPRWQTLFLADVLCGSGCAFGFVISDWGMFLGGILIASSFLWGEYIVDFVFAYAAGIAFQYLSTKQLKMMSAGETLKSAFKVDSFPVFLFELGLFAWMAVVRLAIFPGKTMQPSSAVYWFMIQIGMILGFVTSLPANWLHLRKHNKEPV